MKRRFVERWTLGVLPVELVTAIISFVSPSVLSPCAVLNRHWSFIFRESTHLWKAYFLNLLGQKKGVVYTKDELDNIASSSLQDVQREIWKLHDWPRFELHLEAIRSHSRVKLRTGSRRLIWGGDGVLGFFQTNKKISEGKHRFTIKFHSFDAQDITGGVGITPEFSLRGIKQSLSLYRCGAVVMEDGVWNGGMFQDPYIRVRHGSEIMIDFDAGQGSVSFGKEETHRSFAVPKLLTHAPYNQWCVGNLDERKFCLTVALRSFHGKKLDVELSDYRKIQN